MQIIFALFIGSRVRKLKNLHKLAKEEFTVQSFSVKYGDTELVRTEKRVCLSSISVS